MLAIPTIGQNAGERAEYEKRQKSRQKQVAEGDAAISQTLDTPQGKKTRVRAGPFASREAAEKALEKMQRIGVSGAIAAKQ